MCLLFVCALIGVFKRKNHTWANLLHLHIQPLNIPCDSSCIYYFIARCRWTHGFEANWSIEPGQLVKNGSLIPAGLHWAFTVNKIQHNKYSIVNSRFLWHGGSVQINSDLSLKHASPPDCPTCGEGTAWALGYNIRGVWREQTQKQITAAQFKTDLSNPSENMWHDLKMKCVQWFQRRANECSRKRGINKKLGCRMKTEPWMRKASDHMMPEVGHARAEAGPGGLGESWGVGLSVSEALDSSSSSSVCSELWYSMRAWVLCVMVMVQGPWAHGSPSTCMGILELLRTSWREEDDTRHLNMRYH